MSIVPSRHVEQRFNLVIEILLVPTDENNKAKVDVARFNLVIEILLVPTKKDNRIRDLEDKLKFQSRNRDTFSSYATKYIADNSADWAGFNLVIEILLVPTIAMALQTRGIKYLVSIS